MNLIKKKTPLSASRIKTLQTCSWEFYSNYHLNLPNVDNSGNILGSTVHNIYELLGNPRHKKYFEILTSAQRVSSVPSIEKYIQKFLAKKGLDPFGFTISAHGEEISHVDIAERMLFSGLNYDFYGKEAGADEEHTEISFDFDVEERGFSYRFRGFIDKLFLIKKDLLAVIRDFKSSKKVYAGKEVTDNIQDLMYRLAVSKLFPEYKKKQTEFVFLQYEDKDGFSIKTSEACDKELNGLEHFLTHIQEIVDNFDEEDAKSNLAKDKGFPKKEDGFSGKIKCGLGTEPNQMKKDGSKIMWQCSAKFGFYFYVLLDGDKIIESKMNENELSKPKDGQKIERRFYKGCPGWKDTEHNKKINAEANNLGFKDIFVYNKNID